MPLEIRELIIKATVGDDSGQPARADNEGDGANEAVLNEVVEKVLAILKEKSER